MAPLFAMKFEDIPCGTKVSFSCELSPVAKRIKVWKMGKADSKGNRVLLNRVCSNFYVSEKDWIAFNGRIVSLPKKRVYVDMESVEELLDASSKAIEILRSRAFFPCVEALEKSLLPFKEKVKNK